jgi:hypothetical protein
MGKGLGYLQRTILAMIEKEAEGAWSIEDLAKAIYGVEPEKKHRVALLRTIKAMKLPRDFGLEHNFRHRWMAYLCDPCSDSSMVAAMVLKLRDEGGCAQYQAKHLPDRTEEALRGAARAREARDIVQANRFPDSTGPMESMARAGHV